MHQTMHKPLVKTETPQMSFLFNSIIDGILARPAQNGLLNVKSDWKIFIVFF